MSAMTLGRVNGSLLAWHALAMCPVLATACHGHCLPPDTAVTLLLALSYGCRLSPMTVAVQDMVGSRGDGIAISVVMVSPLTGRS